MKSEIDETLLTLEDAAHLLGRTDQLPSETIRRLGPVFGSDARFAGHVERLEALARAAGIETDVDDWPATALYCHRDFDRLVATDGWQHPAEVLDPDGSLGICYHELVRIAEARAQRAREPDRLLAIKDRLEQAWADEQARQAPVRDIVTLLRDHDPDAVEQLLSLAAAEYRRQRPK